MKIEETFRVKHEILRQNKDVFIKAERVKT